MKRSLTLKTIKQIDKSDMLDLLLDFPLQCKASLDIAGKSRILFKRRDFTKIVFVGAGGSAIGADLVRSYLYFESRLPIAVYREYQLPSYVDSQTLVLVASYSGNTEETLSSYVNAKEKGASIIAISSGGKLKEYALNDNITHIEVPLGLPPRCALGYLSIIPLAILAKLGLIKDPGLSVNEVIKVLEDLKKDNLAKDIARKLVNKFAVIYSASLHFDVCATRLRCQLNENSKALALSHVLPEMNHNEIVGWQNPKMIFKNFVVVVLQDKYMHARVLKRIEITKEILKKEGVTVLELWSKGEGLLSRIFSLIYIGDFISYYLAILYGVDPTPVEKVASLKKKLSGE